MARVVDNQLTKGLSGCVGNMICFRQIGGRTFVVRRPRKRPEYTENQGKQRSRFKQAVYYASIVLEDPAKREAYAAQAKEGNLRSAYLAAMRNPEITDTYIDSYQGKVGDPILIVTAQPHKITEALVTIKQADHTIVETGNAVRVDNKWVYIVTLNNTHVAGTIIAITVKDRMGKIDMKEFVKSG